jgi:branched-chain amino acid transport system ATP-binding protein
VSAPPIVEATGLHTFYGDSHILHGIDFTVARGETIGLMGRNGMGKTTLLRSVLGLTPPRRGEVKINGKVMTGAKPYTIARERLAFVPEGRGIFADLTVREHLLLAERKSQSDRRDWTVERVAELFPRLAERFGQRGGLLSGGEQQMLTIARALVTNPELLVLDEATEGLAPLIAREIWATLRLVRSTGIGAIIVDKNFAAMRANADRVVVLVKGRVAFDGSSDALAADRRLLDQYLGV